jgi:hypothetical protein
MTPDPTGTESHERSPEEVREDIERTRAELGDTVEAVALKADVKTQAKAKLKSATPDSVGEGAAQVGTAARENPVPVGIAGALVAGIALGWWLGRR